MGRRSDGEPSLSLRLRKEIKSIKISAQEKAFADLVAIGWDQEDAYLMTLYVAAYSVEVNRREMNKLMLEGENFRKYFTIAKNKYDRMAAKAEEAQSSASSVGHKEINLNERMSKENQLKELYIARDATEPGSPAWLQATKLIADITNAKKDEVKEEEKVMHYYRPLHCKDCSLYIEKEDALRRKRIKESES